MYDKIIIIGIFISLIFSEITGFSASGLIVPGYIAININNPYRILWTLGISLATYLIVKLLSKYLIIYGKRQFALCIGISVILQMFILSRFPIHFGVIGNVIAGIMANEWIKEGIFRSLVSLTIVVLIVLFIMVLMDVPIL